MKLLMIIAKQDFRDEEFQVPYDHFKSKGVEVDVASTEAGNCFGMFGTVVEAERSLDDIALPEYFAVVIAGGAGAKPLADNAKLREIVQKAKEHDIIIAAICIAPTILAKAGILEGKKATVWNDDKEQSPILLKNGADYVNEDVVVDGRIITGKGPNAAQEFAEKIMEVAECEDCWIQR